MTIKEYLKETAERVALPSIYAFDAPLKVRKGLTCKDGFCMSVQASQYHYCTPREDLFNGEYTHIEIGFPSEAEELIRDYAEDEEDLTKTVYAYVPVEIVEQVIKKHGGMVATHNK